MIENRKDRKPDPGSFLWTITYAYDDNGNLTSKVDARSITATFAYDSINRPTAKSYSDGTPTVSYYYDSQTLPSGAPSYTRGYTTGRLVASIYGSGSEGTYRGYDEMGQVVRQYQRTDSVNYLVEATYNLAGAMASEIYPSVPGASDRRTVSFSYDNAARLSGLSSSATSYAPAASVGTFTYAPTSALTSQTYGNNLIHAVSYNSRQQTSEIKLGTSGNSTSVVDLNYSYGTTANNGNLQSVTYAGGGLSYTQSYSYDSLNRLSAATETNGGTNWSQTNVYDRYGNRQIDYGGGTYNLAFSSSNNRITTSGFSYDSAGNLTNDGYHAYTFDAENKIKTVDSTTAYTYDGEGQRVRKLVGENTRFVYGLGGALVAEFDGSSGNLKKEYVNGPTLITIEPTAVNSNGTQYSMSDHLGTPRIVSDSSAGVVSRHDYMPFGEELGASVGGRTTGMGFSVADGLRQKFTSKERDIETGLDYFGARYYGSTQGRFTSADPFSIIQMRQSAPNDNKTHAAFMQFIGDPRRWNRFAYAVNSPLVFTDKTGLDIMIIENHKTDGNPIGHTAIAITGRGVYSMGNGQRGDRRDDKNNILGGGVKDYILRELPRRDTTIVIIKTTPEQDAAAAASMENQAASKPQLGRANIFSDNCTTRVQEALDAAGISRAPQNFESMPGSAGARVIQNGNSPTAIEIPQDSNLTAADRQAIQQFEPARNTSPVAAPGTPGGTPVVTMPAQTQRRKRPEDE